MQQAARERDANRERIASIRELFREQQLAFLPAPNVGGNRLNPSRRYIAAEVEVASAEDTQPLRDYIFESGIGCVYDGSVASGFELTTQPAQGDRWVEHINNVLDATKASGGAVNSGCGVHVHVDCRDHTWHDVRRLAILWCAIETGVYAFVDRQRSMSEYARPTSPMVQAQWLQPTPRHRVAAKHHVYETIFGERLEHEGLTEKRLRKYSTRRRYTGLNLHSWFLRQTVECRVHHGTLDMEEIAEWGIMMACIVDHAYRSSERYLRKLPHALGPSAAMQALYIQSIVPKRTAKHLAQRWEWYFEPTPLAAYANNMERDIPSPPKLKLPRAA